MSIFQRKIAIPNPAEALSGRADEMPISNRHFVNGHPLKSPFPVGMQLALFGLGCFWGAERVFWETPGVFTTAVGYAGGFTPNPTYHEVCSGRTGHSEVVRVVFDPNVVFYLQLLQRFWQAHDPTQGARQGNDIGTQYRSGIYTYDDEQQAQALTTKKRYQEALLSARHGRITTEILPAREFYYAEDYHQQYLAKHPDGYCGLGGLGVTCPAMPEDCERANT